ncbi:hypothetical protein TTRE_0000461401 [Trichuris trichiura]|uniref:BTB domain-containing protein n=1 Tax=Trichuris trichiura TaxID=36087 RepID=A0A077Z791_TRITR|nr:hypothetical protein TTRE_0000461401 [Trichuris trichiura]
MIRDGTCASRYNAEKANLRSKVASHLRDTLTTLIGNDNFADLELRSKDGLCLPAHSCILRCRAPEFFSCNVGVNFEREKSTSCFNKTVVNVSTMDSDCLTKFVHYVYANSDDAEAAIVPGSETVDLINEEALIGSSESRQSARTYICESFSTNIASWDDAFGDINKSGNSFEIISQFKPSECLSSENAECLEDCIPGSLELKESADDEISPAAVSVVLQDETFLSGDDHAEKREKTETSDSPLVETPKVGTTKFVLTKCYMHPCRVPEAHGLRRSPVH